MMPGYRFSQRTFPARLTLMGFVLVILFLSSCDDAPLNPITPSDQQATIWGTLDMNADIQRLRVVPIRNLLDARLAEKVELELRSIEVETGNTVIWTSSEFTFDDGTIGTLFEAKLKVQPQYTYRIELRSPSFPLVTSAETAIPAIPVATIFEEDVTLSTGPSGAVIRATQQIVWNEMSREPYQVEQWYRFLEFSEVSFLDIKMPYSVPATYQESLNALDIRMDLRRQRDTLDTKVNLDQLALVGLGQTITILDDAFVPPGGKFDPEVLAQPGTMSNVENGFGFVGSVGRFSIEWVIANRSAEILSYSPLNVRQSVESARGPGTYPAELSEMPWAMPIRE